MTQCTETVLCSLRGGWRLVLFAYEEDVSFILSGSFNQSQLMHFGVVLGPGV